MPRIVEGNLAAAGRRFAIVLSRFNHFVADKLLAGAVDALVRHGAGEDDIEVFRTPGSFEIPAVAQRLAKAGRHDAVICLGVLIRGDTPHFDYISAEVTKGVAQAGMLSDVPVIYGVLTTDTLEQAIDRAGTKSGNKGFDAAVAAIEMANLFAELRDRK
jgi:6,7-dimethyl-8-ribityllumazine synthase